MSEGHKKAVNRVFPSVILGEAKDLLAPGREQRGHGIRGMNGTSQNDSVWRSDVHRRDSKKQSVTAVHVERCFRSDRLKSRLIRIPIVDADSASR
jgi:hypothetical protein